MNELNRKARNGAIFYLSVVFIFFIFYFYFKLNIFWVYGVSFLFIIFDILCITLWCPFRNYFIKNKCCNTCRIFNWGYIMVTFPLIVIPNFYTYSLIILSFLIFIKWEFNHRKFPERFFEFSNSNLKCQNCKYSLGFCRVRNARMKLNLKEN